MSNHLDRIVDRKKSQRMPDQVADGETVGEGAASFDSLERISVYLELINHAETRAQALAGMALILAATESRLLNIRFVPV